MDPVVSAISALEDRVVDEAYATLQRRGEPHYRAGDTRRKLLELFRQVVASIEARDPSTVAVYSEKIAVERLQTGFSISEIQAGFNVLEESMWAHVVGALEVDQRTEAVEAISLALRAGRDALARAYVSSAAAGASQSGGQEGPAEPALVATVVLGQIGVITMHDHSKRNALGSRMSAQIQAALESFRVHGARAVIIRAATEMGVWSSGHDIAELPRGRRDPLAYDDALEECVRAVRSYPLPILAMIHGSVWGGAFDLVLSCDVVIADETATFAITPVNLGLPNNTTGLLHFLGRLPTNIVKEMFFTARPINAEQAERWMVVNHLVPAAELESFTLEVANTMAEKAPLALTAVKEQLRVLSDYQPVAAQVYERIQALRRQAYDSTDYLEGLTAFMEKRPPHFRGE